MDDSLLTTFPWRPANPSHIYSLFSGGIKTSPSSLHSYSALRRRKPCLRRRSRWGLYPRRCAPWKKPTATWGRRWRPWNVCCVKPKEKPPRKNRPSTSNRSTSPRLHKLTQIRTPTLLQRILRSKSLFPNHEKTRQFPTVVWNHFFVKHLQQSSCLSDWQLEEWHQSRSAEWSSVDSMLLKNGIFYPLVCLYKGIITIKWKLLLFWAFML